MVVSSVAPQQADPGKARQSEAEAEQARAAGGLVSDGHCGVALAFWNKARKRDLRDQNKAKFDP